METKTCSKCGEVKAVDCFYKNKKNKSGLYSECKDCNKKTCKAWLDKNKEKGKEVRRIYAGKWSDRNRDLISKNNKKNSQLISNSYAARSMGMRINECSAELLELKRQQILFSRFSKEFKRAIKESGK